MGWKRARDLERMRDLMREEETGRAPLLSSARRGGSDLHLVVSHTHARARSADLVSLRLSAGRSPGPFAKFLWGHILCLGTAFCCSIMFLRCLGKTSADDLNDGRKIICFYEDCTNTFHKHI
jgi:hypothetical protein